MIQEIAPKIFRNEYRNKKAEGCSGILIFRGREVLVQKTEEGLGVPTLKMVEKAMELSPDDELRYLFSIDDRTFFLLGSLGMKRKDPDLRIEGFHFEDIYAIRTYGPKDMVFGLITAYQLSEWYESNRFCGRCGSLMKTDEKERRMNCTHCTHLVYPRIAPTVIVGVTNGKRILLTKYAGRAYTRYALIAGFTEIGETVEETVRREVLEEVGVKVKNITYYKSQPWGYDSNLLLGFFAELDGDDTIVLDTEELASGEWVAAEDIHEEDDGISLTREMMLYFKRNAETVD